MKYKIINIDMQIANDIKTEIMQNYTLPIQFKLFNNMIPFDATGYNVRAEMLKADKTFIIQTKNITINKDEILFIANEDFTRISGIGKLQIILYKDDEITGTWIITVNIKQSAISAEDIPSKNIITSLEELRNEIKNADEQKNILVNTIETEKKNVEDLIEEVNKNISDSNVIPTKEYSSYFKDITTTNYINDTLDCRNGYFKNIGIKGNTLVNLIDNTPKIISQWVEKTSDGCIFKNPNAPMNVTYSTNLFKANTTYTVSFSVQKDDSFLNLSCDLYPDKFQEFEKITSNGIKKIKFTTPQDIQELQSFRFYVDGERIGICTIKNLIILEGDYTNKEMPFFNGIKSIGELNPIKIISNNINMANLDYNNIAFKSAQQVNIIGNKINLTDSGGVYHRVGFNLNLKKNTKYIIKGKRLDNFNDKNSCVNIRRKNTGVAVTNDLIENELNATFNTTDDSEFLLFFYSNLATVESKNVTWENISIIEETKNQEFISNQRDILELENIILPGLPNGVCDIYDKNNKIIRNVDKLVFNGSENWELYDTTETNSEETLLFRLLSNNIQKIENASNILSDKFPNLYIWNINKNNEGIFISMGGSFYIRILKTKLSTQDLFGFKKWLSQNNTTVYISKVTPTFEDIKENKSLQCFADGIVTFEDTFYPNLELTYPTTFNSAMLTNSIELNNFNNIIEYNTNIINTNTTNITKNTTDINKNISSINSLNTNLTNTINSFSISQSGTNTTLKMANNAKMIYYSDFFQIDSGTYPYGRDVKFPTAFPTALVGLTICGRRIGSDIFGLKNSEIWNKNKEGFSFTGTMESGKIYAIEVLAIGY